MLNALNQNDVIGVLVSCAIAAGLILANMWLSSVPWLVLAFLFAK